MEADRFSVKFVMEAVGGGWSGAESEEGFVTVLVGAAVVVAGVLVDSVAVVDGVVVEVDGCVEVLECEELASVVLLLSLLLAASPLAVGELASGVGGTEPALVMNGAYFSLIAETWCEEAAVRCLRRVLVSMSASRNR